MSRLFGLAAALLSITPAFATTWEVDLVDGQGPAKSSSLKVDKRGNIHVAYVVDDGNRFPLKYAFRDRSLGRWFVMKVADGAATCSLVLDRDQHPHISYVDYGTASGSTLRYVRWDGNAWKKEQIVLNSDTIAYFSSIALDPQGRPAISFYEYRGPRDTEIRIRLRTVALIDGYWQVRTVDSQEGSGKFNCIAADSDSNLHLAYANVSAGTAGMRYAFWDGKGWKLDVVDGAAQNKGDTVGYSACLALDRDGDPHLTYMNMTHPGIKYAARKNGRWQVQTIEALAATGYPDRNSIALDGEDRPYLSYYDAGRGELKVAHRNDGKWSIEIVDSGGAGFNSSLQVEDGVIYISYAAASSGLKVARRPIEQPATDQP